MVTRCIMSQKQGTEIEKRARQIGLSSLSGYNPELNPGELLNQDARSNAGLD